jgi:hypothetical protein
MIDALLEWCKRHDRVSDSPVASRQQVASPVSDQQLDYCGDRHTPTHPHTHTPTHPQHRRGCSIQPPCYNRQSHTYLRSHFNPQYLTWSLKITHRRVLRPLLSFRLSIRTRAQQREASILLYSDHILTVNTHASSARIRWRHCGNKITPSNASCHQTPSPVLFTWLSIAQQRRQWRMVVALIMQ